MSTNEKLVSRLFGETCGIMAVTGRRICHKLMPGVCVCVCVCVCMHACVCVCVWERESFELVLSFYFFIFYTLIPWNQWCTCVMLQRAVNFASAYVPLDTMVEASNPDDCLSVSAGQSVMLVRYLSSSGTHLLGAPWKYRKAETVKRLIRMLFFNGTVQNSVQSFSTHAFSLPLDKQYIDKKEVTSLVCYRNVALRESVFGMATEGSDLLLCMELWVRCLARYHVESSMKSGFSGSLCLLWGLMYYYCTTQINRKSETKKGFWWILILHNVQPFLLAAVFVYFVLFFSVCFSAC